MTQRPRPQTRPLDGLRVLDLSRAVSGPLAGRILADLGADVVRAELPGTDVTQAFGKVTRGRSGLYSHVNAGKRSILLDLHRPGDVARLLDLAAACDVLVAFWDGSSKGTRSTVERALDSGKEVHVFIGARSAPP